MGAFSPVKMNEWWAFEAALAAGSVLIIEKSLFALDTGASFITVPRDSFQTVLNAVIPDSSLKGCTYSPQVNVYTCPCLVRNDMHIIYLLIGGNEYPVYP